MALNSVRAQAIKQKRNSKGKIVHRMKWHNEKNKLYHWQNERMRSKRTRNVDREREGDGMLSLDVAFDIEFLSLNFKIHFSEMFVQRCTQISTIASYFFLFPVSVFWYIVYKVEHTTHFKTEFLWFVIVIYCNVSFIASNFVVVVQFFSSLSF